MEMFLMPDQPHLTHIHSLSHQEKILFGISTGHLRMQTSNRNILCIHF